MGQVEADAVRNQWGHREVEIVEGRLSWKKGGVARTCGRERDHSGGPRAQAGRRERGTGDGGLYGQWGGRAGRQGGGADEWKTVGEGSVDGRLSSCDGEATVGKGRGGQCYERGGAVRPPQRSRQQRRRLTKGTPPTAMTAPDVLFGTVPRCAPP